MGTTDWGGCTVNDRPTETAKLPLGSFPPEPSSYTESAGFTTDGSSATLRAAYERAGSIARGT